jgi:hypothetical protein
LEFLDQTLHLYVSAETETSQRKWAGSTVILSQLCKMKVQLLFAEFRAVIGQKLAHKRQSRRFTSEHSQAGFFHRVLPSGFAAKPLAPQRIW